jgi:integrase
VSTWDYGGHLKGAIRKPRTPGGAWSYRIDLGFDDSGKRRQRQVGNFATKRVAQAALNEALAGLQQGSYIAPSKQTVRDFLEVWIDTIKPEIALTAWTNYGEVVERYVLPYLGAIRLADLSAMDIKRWHGALLDHGRRDGKPLAVNSVKLSHRVLHRALADGVRWNVMPTNPASSARVPKGEHKEMSVWTSAEARRFLDSLVGDRLQGLWALALHTGMRRGELAGLRWSDVDLERATLTIAQQRTTAGKETVTTTPKARSQRQLLLAEATVGVLRDHLERQEAERLAAGVAWVDSGYVFVDEAGVPLLPQRLTKTFASAIARVDVPKIRLHDVRHTMATSALEAGVHPKVVQEQLGHATIAVTMDTYSHVPQAVRRESTARIAGLFE